MYINHDTSISSFLFKSKGKEAYGLLKMMHAWKEQADKLSSEEISREEYDNWRYYHPQFDTTHAGRKFPQKNSAMLL